MVFLKSKRLWKDSALLGLAIVGVAASIMGIAGTSFADFFAVWAERLGITIVIYIVIVALVVVAKYIMTKTGITVGINGISVHIKQGDLFAADGLRVIPFNEYYDTTVDDKMISHSSLNGIFIDSYVDSVDELRQAIQQDDESETNEKRTEKNGRFVYPLGRIITYQNYLLLALTRFDEQNMAHISKIQYEKCLMTMWHEISRTYAGKPVFLPLLGSGITRFDDVPNKSHFDLLKCMLCTLKSSGENINAPITILLTADIMQKLNIYEAKGVV